VQKPPNFLDHITARNQKQVAYDERVLQAEDEVAGIICDIADFLSGMSSTGLVTVCINASDSLKRGETIIGGQFWHQEGRSMTVTNPIMDGMPNTREAAILSAAAEAIEWTNPIETFSSDGKRRASRIVVYPADIPPIEEAMAEFAQNPSDREDGSHIAFTKILSNVEKFENPPRILRADSSDLAESEFAPAVPLWLNIANQVSVGSRNLVLEDGPDIHNSSDEDSPQDERGEELTGMYANGLKAPVVLSQSEVARQRATRHALKESGMLINSDTPDSTPVASDSTQSTPSSPTQTRCASRFDDPDSLKSQVIPRAKTPTGDHPQKESKPRQFLSDSSGVLEDEPAPAQLLSSRIVPEEEVPRSKQSSASAAAKNKEDASGSRRKTTSGSSRTSESDQPMATRSRSKASGAGSRGEGNSRATGLPLTGGLWGFD
jgi:hypothetical protein